MEIHAARSTSTKEKRLTRQPSRRWFAKRSPSTVPASPNLRRRLSPSGRIACSLHYLDGLAQALRFVRAHAKPPAILEPELNCSAPPNVVEPAVGGQMDAPAVPPGILHRGPGFDLSEVEGAADPPRPEPEDEPVLIDLDRHRAEAEYPKHRDDDNEPEDGVRTDSGKRVYGGCEGSSRGDAGHSTRLSVVIHVWSSLTVRA